MNTMKPGSKDIKIQILISGEELSELKRHTWLMEEAFGLDSKIENYRGVRPIGFYQWDLDCLINAIDIALDDNREYPDKSASGYKSLMNLLNRFKEIYHDTYEK